MAPYRLSKRLLLLSAPLLLLAACAPVRPIVRDTVGREVAVNNNVVSAVTPVGYPGLFTAPHDAAPDPEATIIYIVGEGPAGPGLFQAPWSGGDVTAVATGAPFEDPTGVAVSSDGATVYVADGKTARGQGAILAVDRATRQVSTVPGTAGSAPRGLEVVAQDGIDYLYYTGAVGESGQPAIYRMPAAGGSAEVIAAGAPLVEPVGVAVTGDGVIYVADRTAGTNGSGAVFRVTGNQVELVTDGFRTGDRIVGATLTLDDGVLLVSAMDAAGSGAQVLGIVLGTGDKFVVTKEVSLHPGSAGVHRAHNHNRFAWADSGGTVQKGKSSCSPCVMRIETP